MINVSKQLAIIKGVVIYSALEIFVSQYKKNVFNQQLV
jgi:hypothetical protein